MIMLASVSALTMAKPTIVMVVLVGVMWYVSKLAKNKLGVGAGSMDPSQLKVVGKRVLEPKKSLYVVEIGSRYILVGTSENGVSMIDNISAEEFDTMAQKADEKVAGTKTALARRFGLAGTITTSASTTDAAAPTADNADSDEPIEEPRFATVGESFSMLLGKARSARAAKSTTPAVGSTTDTNDN